MRVLALALGAGLVLAALSELAFYPLEDAAAWGLAMAYGGLALPALVAALIVRPGPWGLAVCAGMFGVMAEGIVVPVLYEAPPFSILWTSIAWHGLISAGLGLWLWRRAARRGWGAAAILALGLGALMGLWGAWSWPVMGEGAGYAAQIALAGATMAAGHLLIGRAGVPAAGRRLGLGCAVAVLALWAAGYGFALFPISLILPALLGLSCLALWWGARGRAVKAWLAPVPPARHAALLLVPVAAIPVQAGLASHAPGWELNAHWALVTCALGGGLWAWALGRGLSGR